MYETLEAFQEFANQKLKAGKLPVVVTFIPIRADPLLSKIAAIYLTGEKCEGADPQLL
jgi:hypothetical protein